MAYVFDLKQVCGGYAYFSTFTLGNISEDDRFEMREPSQVVPDNFSRALEELGQKVILIETEGDYRRWLYLHGWSIVEPSFARAYMPQWLKQHKCITSSLRSYTDIGIASPGVLKRSYRGKAKREIHDRDGGACLVCGAHNALTLQHVWPFSAAGETSSRNMVTLCEKCNQEYKTEISPELYRMAGLHHGYEPSLLKHAPDRKAAMHRAAYLSANLMHTRCDIW